MKALLDTCTLLWAIYAPARLGKQARKFIGDENNEILVSAATAWEIATKVRIGRLPEAVTLEENYSTLLAAADYLELPIRTEDALRAGRLTTAHKDPFDRILAAQAIGLDIPLLTPDAAFDQFAVRRVW